MFVSMFLAFLLHFVGGHGLRPDGEGGALPGTSVMVTATPAPSEGGTAPGKTTVLPMAEGGTAPG